MACSAGPDLDVGLFAYGVEYEDMWGHRGMMHSLFFALLVALAVVTVFYYRDVRAFRRSWWGFVAFFFALTASHGFLDAFTNGGLGIAFFAPFDNTRYFFSCQPIEVSNFGLTSLFTARGAEVLWSEFKWIWLPASAAALLVIAARRLMVRSASADRSRPPQD